MPFVIATLFTVRFGEVYVPSTNLRFVVNAASSAINTPILQLPETVAPVKSNWKLSVDNKFVT